jgi:hypothetical protein
MDRESEQSTKLLGAIAETTQRLFRMAESMSALPEVIRATQDFQCSKNFSYTEFGVGSPCLLDWYVDVELSTGKSLIWVLEVHWPDNNWVIESRIETPGEHGAQTVQEFPCRIAETVADVIEHLELATAELIDSAGSLQTLNG